MLYAVIPLDYGLGSSMKAGLFAIATIELYYFVFAGNEICPGKIKNIVYTVLCALIGLSGALFFMPIQAAIVIGIMSLLFVMFYSDGKWKSIFPPLILIVVIFLLDILWMEFNGNPSYWILGIAGFIFLILTIFSVQRRYFNVVTIVIAGLNMLLACGLSFYLNQHIWAIVFLIGIELLLEGSVQITNLHYKKNNLRLKEEMMLHQYEEIKEMYLNMRGWRHDYHNHVQVLKAYLDAGNTESAREYLNSIEHELGKVDTFVKSGNLMVDAVLNSKLTIALANKINVDCDVYLPENLFIDDSDICTLLGNVLDNAIEACNGLEDAFIRIYMVMRKKQLYLSVQNSSDHKLIEDKDKFISMKRGNHGLGLKRVDMVVKKHDGFLYLSKEPGVFGIEISIPEPDEICIS